MLARGIQLKAVEDIEQDGRRIGIQHEIAEKVVYLELCRGGSAFTSGGLRPIPTTCISGPIQTTSINCLKWALSERKPSRVRHEVDSGVSVRRSPGGMRS